jgi:hypothetical protein
LVDEFILDILSIPCITVQTGWGLQVMPGMTFIFSCITIARTRQHPAWGKAEYNSALLWLHDMPF